MSPIPGPDPDEAEKLRAQVATLTEQVETVLAENAEMRAVIDAVRAEAIEPGNVTKAEIKAALGPYA